MSHFAMIVTGDYDAALAPYHEFECTGTNDQYVQEFDITKESRVDYEKATESAVVSPDGTRFWLFTEDGNYDPRFVNTAKQSWEREKVIPSGYTEIEVPASERRTFSQWLEHDDTHHTDSGHKYIKYRYYVTDTDGNVTKVVKRTNPNAKWDWYVLGGRYSNRLILKDGSKADTARAGDVDWEANRKAKEQYAADEWTKVRALVGNLPYTSWQAFREQVERGVITIDDARDQYHAQESVKALHKDDDLRWIESSSIAEILSVDINLYATRQGLLNGAYWGLLHDSKWAEKGEMGWFGMSDSTDDSEIAYANYFWSVVPNLDPDTIVSVIDCHI